MKTIFLIFFIAFLNACSMQNSRLLSYESISIGEDSKLIEEVSQVIVPKYGIRKIYIDEIIDVNACGDYDGDIYIIKDSIYLIQDNSSFTLCASKKFLNVKYIIDNPENKTYKFAFKYK